jgi:ATP-binding cassette, subfamily B, bacterial MsbA
LKEYINLLAYVLQYKRYAILNIICNLCSVLFSLFSLTMVAPFLNVLFNQVEIASPEPLSFSVKSALHNFNFYLSNYVLEHGKLNALILICVLVVVMFFFKNLFRYLAMYFLAPIRNGVVRDLRRKMFAKTLELPLSYFTEEKKGDLMSRMTNDVQEIEWSIMQSLEVIFREPITVTLFLTTLFLMSAKLFLFVLILLPLAGILIGLIGKTLRRTSGKSKELMGDLMSNIDEALGGARIIKGFNAENHALLKFDFINELYRKTMVKLYRKRDLSSPMSEFLGAIVLAVVMYFGGQLALNESLEPSVFIAFVVIFSQVIPPARAFTDAYYNVQKGLASAERINKILDAHVSIKNEPNAVEFKGLVNEIAYKEVGFAYIKGDDGWALQNVSFTLQRGKTVALVGQSGSGKTTLADLLPRFYDADRGEILIDNVPLTKMDIASFRQHIGIVSQESILFNDTILNNIAFGMEQSNLDAVISAAKVANAHDFIQQLPQGYDTNIGDRGSKLSGGQRQRIAIARAVLKNPEILIMDEATSALDTESEKLVQDALNELMKNRTTLIIAHRLSTVYQADLILVMHRGQIIERGTHSQLLQANGSYKKLCDMQAFN